MRLSRRRGSILLEVIVAMTILVIAGLTVVAASRSISASAVSVASIEAEIDRADRYMSAISTWHSVELDRHLGKHRRGEWMLEVERHSAQEYDVRLYDSTGAIVRLETTLYRPDLGEE